MQDGAEVATPYDDSFLGHPRGLPTLFFTEMWERFSYYGMRALLLLFMVAPKDQGGLGLSVPIASGVYGLYTASVYLFTIPGGWVADRLLGLRKAVLAGGVLIASGHYCLLFERTLEVFYLGLVLIVLGTGLLKANVSSIVGQLYPEGDSRLDAGFSIFYMGINLGAFFSPLICGPLGQRWGWHWGFGVAAFGMTLGLIQYVLGLSRLGNAGLLREEARKPGRLWTLLLGSLAAFATVLYVLRDHQTVVFVLGTVAVFLWLLSEARDRGERQRMVVIIILCIFAILFWMGFEQAGSSLTLFAERQTRNVLFGWEFPSTGWQSLEPVLVILLAPAFAALWMWMGKREPSRPTKFAVALVVLASGFLGVAYAARLYAQDGARVSPLWLGLLYLSQAIGEVCLSPVGLASITKLAPKRLVGVMMGVWFLALSLGNFFAGQVAGLYEALPLPRLFGSVFLMIGGAGLVLALLVKPINRLTAES
jgi:POT family proton-dependent oligopeptide transporter